MKNRRILSVILPVMIISGMIYISVGRAASDESEQPVRITIEKNIRASDYGYKNGENINGNINITIAPGIQAVRDSNGDFLFIVSENATKGSLVILAIHNGQTWADAFTIEINGAGTHHIIMISQSGTNGVWIGQWKPDEAERPVDPEIIPTESIEPTTESEPIPTEPTIEETTEEPATEPATEPTIEETTEEPATTTSPTTTPPTTRRPPTTTSRPPPVTTSPPTTEPVMISATTNAPTTEIETETTEFITIIDAGRGDPDAPPETTEPFEIIEIPEIIEIIEQIIEQLEQTGEIDEEDFWGIFDLYENDIPFANIILPDDIDDIIEIIMDAVPYAPPEQISVLAVEIIEILEEISEKIKEQQHAAEMIIEAERAESPRTADIFPLFFALILLGAFLLLKQFLKPFFYI